MTPGPRTAERQWLSEDHWEVLGLNPGADADALKQAFRREARRWHPDLNANDSVAEERFKRINEAYAVLSDPKRRQAWEAGEDQPHGAAADIPFATGFPEFDDYLDALFGRRGRGAAERQTGPQAPPWEAGAEPVTPEPQAGERFSPPDRAEPNPGAVTPSGPSAPVRASGDLETLVELSPDQALTGTRLELALPDGTLVEVWTPPLAGDGWRLRLAGVAPGGADHFLHLRVRTEEGLRIDGLRVLYRLELHPADAALGCQVVIPTLEGPVRLRVPPGSSSGRLLRLRDRGLCWGDERGDQLVELRIVLDRPPDEDEQSLYRRLRELDQERRSG
ncbi:MAG: DnaJ domain-containing protein [Synechococcaceae cyanobacterium]